MSWFKPYNISGSAEVDGRLDDLCVCVKSLLQCADVPIVGHFTGETTIGAESDRGLFLSAGFLEDREFYALVPGGNSERQAFAQELEALFQLHRFAYRIKVHEHVVNAEQANRA